MKVRGGKCKEQQVQKRGEARRWQGWRGQEMAGPELEEGRG